MVERLRFHLGLHLHRFIEDGRLAIAIEVVTQGGDGGSDEGVERTVIALNPFGYEQTERTFEPRSFEVSLHGIGTLVIEGHIWPPNASSRSYKLDNAAQRQGLYIYRNDRLIQAGGWNGQRHDSEPHLSLARLRLDLPPRHDSAFSLEGFDSATLHGPFGNGGIQVTGFYEAGGGTTAYVVKDGVAEQRPIKTGAVSVREIEVLDGLAAGDEIVISDTEDFRNAPRVMLAD
jgi:hypothetical protein